MKRLIFLIVFFVACSFYTMAQVKFDQGKYRNFQKTAKQNNQNYLVFFYAEWCKHSRYMIDEVFADNNVSSTMKGDYMLYGVDVDKQKSWGKVYNIKYFPTMIIFNANGEELRRANGRLTKLEMLKFLKG